MCVLKYLVFSQQQQKKKKKKKKKKKVAIILYVQVKVNLKFMFINLWKILLACALKKIRFHILKFNERN